MRVTINNYESLISNAEKRSVRNGDTEVVPRLSDLHSVYASTAGKIEMEYAGEEKKEEELIERLINRAVLKVFDKAVKIEELKEIVAYFDQGWGVEVSDMSPVEEYIEAVRTIPGLKAAVAKLGPARVRP